MGRGAAPQRRRHTPELRDAYNARLPKVTAFHADLGQDLRLFDRYRALAASPAFAALDAAKQRVVANELRDFRLGGAELPADGKARLKAVQEELAELSAQFDDNVLDATDDWALYVDERGRARRTCPPTSRRSPGGCRSRRQSRDASSRCACPATCR